MDEVLVTDGAYEALYCAIQGHVNPGDEVTAPTLGVFKPPDLK